VIDPMLNLGLILFCVLIVVAFVRSGYLQSSASPDQPKRSSDEVGRKISLQGVDWSKSEQTLVMFLNTQCHYCQKSEPFYRELSSDATDHQKVRLIAVFPQPLEKSKEYLDHAGISVDDLRQPGSGDLKVKGTPTLVLVNGNGIATNQWIGLLSPTEEAEIMTRLGLKPRERHQAN
jgi:thiol-disulfide isomerase/thioredoxin